jgi:hypothetical protein
MVAVLSLAGWSLAVAIAGFVIAVATYLTNRRAIRREEADRKKAIEDAWAFEWAAQRPVLYPVLSRIAAVSQLPVKNGGRGPALNVVAELEQHNEDGGIIYWEVSVGNVAAGDVEVAGFGAGGGFVPTWSRISGVLSCTDLAGGEYRQSFRFSKGARGELQLAVEEQEHLTAAEVRVSPK